MDKQLNTIAGCFGAVKIRASSTILPDILNCKAFIITAEIAYGSSPFQPMQIALKAGRIMLNRINNILKSKMLIRNFPQ